MLLDGVLVWRLYIATYPRVKGSMVEKPKKKLRPDAHGLANRLTRG
jgi:hypothetical protein